MKLVVEPTEGGVYNAYEWVVPTAIAAYLAKPYLEGLLKEAAKEHYPTIRNALVKLADKLLRRERDGFVVIGTKGKLADEGPSVVFSIYSRTRDSTRSIKFAFYDYRSLEEYERCIDTLFATMLDHLGTSDATDDLSRQIAALDSRNRGTVVLRFDKQQSRWEIVDLMREAERMVLLRSSREMAGPK